MSSKNLTVGLLRKLTKCLPYSFETFDYCAGGVTQLYTLQLMAIGRLVNYVVIERFSSPTNFNGYFVDTSTMLGQLSIGKVDWIIHTLYMTEKRLPFIDYGFQTAEDSLGIFMDMKWVTLSNESNSTYFFMVFGKQIIIAYITMLIIKLMFVLIGRKQELFPWFRKASFGFAFISFVLFYNISLKADFMLRTNLKLPFRTIQELAELVKMEDYHLVVDNVHDFRMEIINNSRNTAIRALRRALIPSKVKLVGSRSIMWKQLHRDRGAFTVHTWRNFLHVDQKSVQDIMAVCPAELPKLAAAHGFPKRSKLVSEFNLRAHFVYEMFMMKRRSMQRRRKYFASENTPANDGYNELRFSDTDILFSLYLILLLFSILIWVGEISYWEYDNTRSCTLSQ